MGRLYPKSFEGLAPREFGIGANILKTRTFDLTNARDLEQIEIGGSCIWAMSASSLSASIDIRINDQLRDPLTFQQGMFVRGIPFSRVYVSHAAQVGATITIFFAVEQDVRNIEIINPSTQFNNINVGEITIDNSWYYNTLKKEAFIGSALCTTGMATTRGHIQLWNPVASGKHLLLEEMQVFTDNVTGSLIETGHYNLELANDGIWGNKYLAEAVGVGEVHEEPISAGVGTIIADFTIISLEYQRLIFKNPILIPAGQSFIVRGINSYVKLMRCIFQWKEIDV